MNWVQVGMLAIGVVLGATVFKGAIPFVQRFVLKVRFRLRHGRKGKGMLFVYSDSSNWKDYIERNILPRIETHAIILNWSRRREWGPRMELEAKLFDHLAGPGEFVPMAILISPLGKARTFRLWQISGNSKHGKARVSREAEQALLEAVKRMHPGGR
ncbi:MAG: hypothetical protein AB1427_20385 [Thermodesulfobacteriota bacterium]